MYIESLLFFVVGVFALTVLTLIIVTLYVWGLRGRIKALERNAGTLSVSEKTSASQVVYKEEEAPAVVQREVPIAPKVEAAAPEGPDSMDRLFVWIKQDFLVKLGAFLLLIAFGWFVSYAFANNWIGPVGRITLGILAGIAFIIGGQFRIQTYRHQGGIFMVVGSTIILLTVFAAREIYDFFTPLSALAIMFLSVTYVALSSVRYNSKALALSSLVLASAAPLLTASPSPDVFGLFSYLLVIVVGTIWIVYLTGWAELSFAALVVTFLYGIPFMFFGLPAAEMDIALMFAFVFAALFFVANTISMTHLKAEAITRGHLIVAGGTGLYLIGWILSAADKQWQSLLFVAWMLVFSFGAFLTIRVVSRPEPFYIYGATSVALLAAATAVELSGAVLVIAFTVELLGILIVAFLLTRSATICSRLSYLFVVPILLSIPHLDPRVWSDGVFDASFFAVTILMVVLFLVGDFYRNKANEFGLDELKTSSVLLTTAGGLYAVAIVWLASHGVLAYNTATMISLIVYTIAGIGLFVAGHARDSRLLRISGGVLIAGVVGRLLLVEVWEMALVGRIVTFFVIGILLMATSFMIKKNKYE